MKPAYSLVYNINYTRKKRFVKIFFTRIKTCVHVILLKQKHTFKRFRLVVFAKIN